MTRMKLHISYDGTGYLGWQRQTKQKGQTIQGELEKALLALTGAEISTMGSGRTDAGVHAKDQVVHFDFDSEKADRFDWVRGLNRHLPESIRARKLFKVRENFHAVMDSQSKTYVYSLIDGESPDPLKTRYAMWVGSKLDIEYLNRLSKCLIGEHDFKSFQTAGTPLATTVRTITEIKWTRTDSDSVEVRISGTGFLKQMVRNLVGTILHRHWLKEQTEENILAILSAKNRTKAHGTAPAKGLCLVEVKYPVELDKNGVQS